MKRKFFGGRNDSRLANDFILLFQERDYAPPKQWKVSETIISIKPLIFGELCDEFYRSRHDFLEILI